MQEQVPVNQPILGCFKIANFFVVNLHCYVLTRFDLKPATLSVFFFPALCLMTIVDQEGSVET